MVGAELFKKINLVIKEISFGFNERPNIVLHELDMDMNVLMSYLDLL